MKRLLFYTIAILLISPSFSCGGNSNHPFAPSPGILLLPTTTEVVIGQTQQFEATVENSSSSVIFSVDGGATNGTIDANGLYTAPAVVPANPTVIVRAKLVDNNEVQETSEVNILQTAP
jgi:hypothetical protein